MEILPLASCQPLDDSVLPACHLQLHSREDSESELASWLLTGGKGGWDGMGRDRDGMGWGVTAAVGSASMAKVMSHL